MGDVQQSSKTDAESTLEGDLGDNSTGSKASPTAENSLEQDQQATAPKSDDGQGGVQRADQGQETDPLKIKIMLPPLMPAPLIPPPLIPTPVISAPAAGQRVGAAPNASPSSSAAHGGADASRPDLAQPAERSPGFPPSADDLAAAAMQAQGVPQLAPPPLLRIPCEATAAGAAAAGAAAGADARRSKRPRSEGGDAKDDGAAGAGGQSWFVIYVDEAWERQRGFRLFEMDAPPPPCGFGQVANVREWCSAPELAPPTGFQVGHQRFLPVKPGIFSPLLLPDRCCLSVQVSRGTQLLDNGVFARYVKIENEQVMVTRAYARLRAQTGGGFFPMLEADLGGAAAAARARAVGALHAGIRPADSPGGGGMVGGVVGVSGFGTERDSMADIATRWRCEVCNIYFTSSQALGGHRINSTDHKQRMDKLRNCDTDTLPATPRLSLYVYSNEETGGQKCKRTRLPPMAQMDGFDRVLLGYPMDVQTALARIQSPAAYFSSCSLDVFRRHESFGEFASKVIQNYFGSSTESFENLLRGDIRKLPEIAESRLSLSHVSESELKVFVRMLLTKKKFLDINRRAVSKRIKGIRKVGGDKLRVLNSKKSRAAEPGRVCAAGRNYLWVGGT